MTKFIHLQKNSSYKAKLVNISIGKSSQTVRQLPGLRFGGEILYGMR